MNSIPVVVIVGRPNVGKSAFFNRIAGDRIAVVSDTPGITRDRVSADAEWRGRRYIAVDTGGITGDREAILWDEISEQTATALEQADRVIQVVDVRDGLTAEDVDAANLVRRYAKPTVVVANKADNPGMAMGAAEFHQLGFERVVEVSALHGSGIEDTLEAVLGDLPPQTGEVGDSEQGIGVALVGRPNVGKSALFNRVIGDNRSIVSPVPGTTRDTIDIALKYGDRKLIFRDTAGIRRRGKVEGGVEKYSVLRSLAAIERSAVCIVMVSAEEFVTAQDTHIGGFVSSALRGAVVVINKWDLASELKIGNDDAVKRIKEEFNFLSSANIVFTSALNNTGISELLDNIVKTHAEYTKKVNATELNDCISYAIGKNEPPPRRGVKVSIFGVKQEHWAPPVFVFDAKNPEYVHFSYRRYLEGQIRGSFGFNGVPIVLRFRSVKK